MEDDAQVPAGENRRGIGSVLAPRDQLDLEMALERVLQLSQALARPGHEHPDLLADCGLRFDAHLELLPKTS